MSTKLKGDDILHLIRLYKLREVLWNMNSRSYRRKDLKRKAIKEIAVEMCLPVDVVLKKLKGLRSTYVQTKRKIVQNQQNGSDPESMYEPSLFWFSEMSFLDTSIIPRTKINNENEDSQHSLDCKVSQNDDNTNAAFEDNVSNSENTETYFEFCAPSPAAKKSKLCDEQPAQFVDEASNDSPSECPKEHKKQVFDVFGESVAIQLKQLPQEEAYLVMAEFQTTLSRKMIKNMQNNLKREH